MDTSVDRIRVGLANAKTCHGLTESKLLELLPGEPAYQVSEGGNGLYVVVSPSGSRASVDPALVLGGLLEDTVGALPSKVS